VVEVTQGLEVGHDVPEGGGRERAVQDAGKALRPHRLPGLDVELDEGTEHLSPSLV